MTDRFVKEAKEYIDKIDEFGGMAEAIEAGYVQREIQDSAYKYQKKIEEKERVVVGVNEFVEEDEKAKADIMKVDEKVEQSQKEKLNEVKEKRDSEAVKKHLKEIRKAAENGDNVMYPIVDAVREYASLGEISNVLRDVYGEYEAQNF